jgi:hypothetical protein
MPNVSSPRHALRMAAYAAVRLSRPLAVAELADGMVALETIGGDGS